VTPTSLLGAGTAHLANDRFRRSGRQSRSDCFGDDARVRSGSSTDGDDLRFARPVGAIGTCEINGKDAPSVRMRHRHRPPTGPHERFLRKRSSESGRHLEPPAWAIAHEESWLPSAAGACFARKAVVRDARQPPGGVPAQSRKQDAAGPTGAVLLLCSASGYVEWGNRPRFRRSARKRPGRHLP
jgi:hypothetical protein